MDRKKRYRADTNTCADHGVWLDDGEFGQIAGASKRARADARKKGHRDGYRQSGNERSYSARRRARVKPRRAGPHPNFELVAEGKRKCPICDKRMEHRKHYGEEVDICIAHGVWFDAGEFENVMARARRGRMRAYDTGYSEGEHERRMRSSF